MYLPSELGGMQLKILHVMCLYIKPQQLCLEILVLCNPNTILANMYVTVSNVGLIVKLIV